jgi:hypothetical protein
MDVDQTSSLRSETLRVEQKNAARAMEHKLIFKAHRDKTLASESSFLSLARAASRRKMDGGMVLMGLMHTALSFYPSYTH